MARRASSRPSQQRLRLRELLPLAETRGVLSLPRVREQLLGEEKEDLRPRPLLPPGAGHLALLLASGALSGVVVRDKGGRRLLLRGSTSRRTRTVEDGEVERCEELFAVHIDALDLDARGGRIAIFDGPQSADRLAAFLAEVRDSLAQAAASALRPLISSLGEEELAGLPPLLRSPLGMQGPAIIALARTLRSLGRALVVGEQGCGKTYISLAAAYAAGCRRLLVLCPPHLAGKWAREARLTIPGVAAVICRRPSDLERARALAQGGRPLACILPREQAKLHYQRKVATWRRPQIVKGYGGRSSLKRDALGDPVWAPACPRCGYRLAPDSARPPALHKGRCPACSDVLLAAQAGVGPRRYALARYVAKRMKRFFDCLVIDEAHEYRSESSLQAEAAMALAGAVPRVICLTGTLLGGYASHLYNLLSIVSPSFRERFDPRQGGRSRFVREYGLRVSERDMETRRTRSRPRPGISPKVTPWLLERGVFLRLDEVVELPALAEEPVLVEPSPPLAEAIARLHQRARRRLQELPSARTATAAVMHSLLSYPDLAWAGEELMDPHSGELLLRAAPLGDGPLPKERELVSLVARELAEGRPCLVYVTYTGSRDITPRLLRLLQEAGVRADVLRADVPPARREAWLMERMASGVQALICQPRLVALGLDLITFPTVIFFQPDPDPFVVRQAARRSYRIGQRQPVRVYYLAYRGSAQELLLALLARKAAASLLLEGEVVGGGLLSLSEEDILSELARLVKEGGAEDAREALRRAAAIDRWAAGRPGWDGALPQPAAIVTNAGLQLPLPGLFP
jgi:hypothetical protein